MNQPVRGRMPRKTKNSKIQKHEIVLDIANVDNMVAILRHAYESAERYTQEQNNGGGNYGRTYIDMNELMLMIEGVAGKNDSEEIKIFYKMDGDMWCAHFEDFVNIQKSVVGFGETKEKAKRNLFVNLYGGTNLQYA